MARAASGMTESDPVSGDLSEETEEDMPLASAGAPPAVNIDEAKDLLAGKGRERGFVTSDELLEGLPVEDLSPEQLEDFLTQVAEHLRQEGIEIIEVPTEEFEGDGEVVGIRLPRGEELLKAPTNDPVRMYLKEIGKVPLLTAPQEVDLAMRIEGGEFATALLQFADGSLNGSKVDQKRFREVVESVCRIREHQL